MNRLTSVVSDPVSLDNEYTVHPGSQIISNNTLIIDLLPEKHAAENLNFILY